MKISFAQNDKIYFHNSKIVEGSVIKINEFTIEYKYIGEDVIQMASKYAIEKVTFKSGREEKYSNKIDINGERDWEKVILLEDISQSAGLTRVGEISSKTALINFRSGSGGDRKASSRLKKEAAQLNCPFAIITYERDKKLGNSQEIKKAIAYKY